MGKMYELNFGLELGLFGNRISATFDVYQRNSFDLIDLIRTSGVGGQYYKYANFGDMRTRGVELVIQTQNILTDKFSWSTTITISGMKQKITRLLNTPNTFDMVAGTGRGNIVGFHVDLCSPSIFRDLTPMVCRPSISDCTPPTKEQIARFRELTFWMHNIQNHTLFTMALLNPNI